MPPERTPTTTLLPGLSAPTVSLSSTLPLPLWPSPSEASSARALGRSSTMLTSMLPLAELPSLSVAVTVKCSCSTLLPWPVAWLSLSSKV
ncbi:hypothetical protein D3C76_1001570 [compost metagenome]